MVKNALDTRMRSGALSLIRPVVVQLSKINTPKGLGRFADLVVCRVTHAPSLTVSKTGVPSTKMSVFGASGIALSPFVYRGFDAIANFF